MYQEIIRQKIVSNIILAFLDHLKPRIFFVDQSWWSTESALFFKKSLDAPLECLYLLSLNLLPWFLFLLIKPAALVLVQWENIHVTLILTDHCFAKKKRCESITPLT